MCVFIIQIKKSIIIGLVEEIGFEVNIIFLPKNKDPDDMIRDGMTKSFKEMIEADQFLEHARVFKYLYVFIIQIKKINVKYT